MRKLTAYGILFLVLCLIPFTRGASADAATKKTVKTYTITTKSKPSKKTTSLPTYNKYTKHYYVFRDILKECEKKGGGEITVKKGTYTITNALCIPSNVTLTLEDGVTIKKGNQTGTDSMKPTKTMFQLIKPSKRTSKGYYKEYNGENNINIIGEGSATIDLKNIKGAIGIIIGHNKDITVTGITFKNMNAGHFIEMDASKNVTIKDCSFLESLESPKHNKEAINIDTPDPITGGFNCAWSAQDRTPNENVIIDNCSFKNIDCAVGTHRYSQNKDKKGKYTINVYHTDIKITNSEFIGMRSYVFNVINWKDVEITDCKISGGSYEKVITSTTPDGTVNTQFYTKYNSVMRLKGADNFTFKNNKVSQVGMVLETFYITTTSADYNALYTDLEFKLTPDNIKDMIFENEYSDIIGVMISTCPLKPGSIQEDEAYAKYLIYGAPGTPDDYVHLFVGLDYMTLAEDRNKNNK